MLRITAKSSYFTREKYFYHCLLILSIMPLAAGNMSSRGCCDKRLLLLHCCHGAFESNHTAIASLGFQYPGQQKSFSTKSKNEGIFFYEPDRNAVFLDCRADVIPGHLPTEICCLIVKCKA